MSMGLTATEFANGLRLRSYAIRSTRGGIVGLDGCANR